MVNLANILFGLAPNLMYINENKMLLYSVGGVVRLNIQLKNSYIN